MELYKSAVGILSFALKLRIWHQWESVLRNQATALSSGLSEFLIQISPLSQLERTVKSNYNTGKKLMLQNSYGSLDKGLQIAVLSSNTKLLLYTEYLWIYK